MRADIRDNLWEAARAELEHNGNYVALVSRAVVENYDKDQPVTIEMDVDDDRGEVVFILTRIER